MIAANFVLCDSGVEPSCDTSDPLGSTTVTTEPFGSVDKCGSFVVKAIPLLLAPLIAVPFRPVGMAVLIPEPLAGVEVDTVIAPSELVVVMIIAPSVALLPPLLVLPLPPLDELTTKLIRPTVMLQNTPLFDKGD